MPSPFRTISCFAVLALLLAFAAPVRAEQPGNAPAAPPAQTTAMPDRDGKGWKEERMERREFREEHEKLRAEHEQLEAERDKLKAQCMDAKGQDRSTCHTQMQALHEKMKDLHQRREAFHQKAMAEHKEWKARHENHPGGPTGVNGPGHGEAKPAGE